MEKSNITQQIRDIVKRKDPLAEIILFGSRARGAATSASDWDVLILLNQKEVSRKTERAFRDNLFEVQLETGESISTFVISKSEWLTKYADTPFYKNVIKDGLYL